MFSFKSMLAAGFGCMLAAGASASTLEVVGRPDAATPISFEIALPLRNKPALQTLLKQLHDPASPQFHRWLTPTEFGLRFGPDSATMARVTGALRARGFAVEASTRAVHVTGTRDAIEALIGTRLDLVRGESGRIRPVAERLPRLPAELAGAVVMSFAPFEHHPMSRHFPLSTDNRNGPDGAYNYNDLKQAYAYPSYQTTVKVGGTAQRLDGTGATIAALMSSDALDSDLQAMFNHENWTATTGTQPPVLYAHIPVNGGAPFDPNSDASFEASLDVQQEIGGAPGAHVVLYNIPDLSDGNVFAGFVTLIEQNSVDLVSNSFGGCELGYFPQYNGGQDYRGVLLSLDELFQQADAQGISVLFSSGDRAGKECPNVGYFYGKPGAHFVPSVSEPADSPNVTAVGGTNLVTTYTPGSLDSTYVNENAWSDPEIPYDVYGFGEDVRGGNWGAGSGPSALFAKPDYQNLVNTGEARARTLPDVGMQVGGCPGGIAKIAKNPPPYCNGGNKPYNGSGNSDRSASIVTVGGLRYGVIGTSSSSPEFASVVALLIERQGRQGNLNPMLYQAAAAQAQGGTPSFHVGIPGFNGYEETLVNNTYSLSTGVGTPIVKNLIGLAKAAPAGTPQTPSNP
jgi:subtilase family serine protease